MNWRLNERKENGSRFGEASRPAAASRLRLGLEAACWMLAGVCGLGLAYTALESRTAMAAARAVGGPGQQAAAQAGASTEGEPVPVGTALVHGDGGVMGRLEIPQVGLTVPVLENYDSDSLRKGVGHIPGTAFPGGLGNLGLAGHRDTFLRPLRNIRKGMEVDVVTKGGKYRYRVDTTEIVTPEQVEVLDIRSAPELTIITCYPFNYIGAAPKRFIVHAHLLSLDPG